MTLNKLIEELQKLAGAGLGDRPVEIESQDENNNETLKLSGEFIVEGETVIIGTNALDETE